jgi:hypothetical protein
MHEIHNKGFEGSYGNNPETPGHRYAMNGKDDFPHQHAMFQLRRRTDFCIKLIRRDSGWRLTRQAV